MVTRPTLWAVNSRWWRRVGLEEIQKGASPIPKTEYSPNCPDSKAEFFLQILVLEVEMKCSDIRGFLNYLFYNRDMGQVDIILGQKFAWTNIGRRHF